MKHVLVFAVVICTVIAGMYYLPWINVGNRSGIVRTTVSGPMGSFHIMEDETPSITLTMTYEQYRAAHPELIPDDDGCVHMPDVRSPNFSMTGGRWCPGGGAMIYTVIELGSARRLGIVAANLLPHPRADLKTLFILEALGVPVTVDRDSQDAALAWMWIRPQDATAVQCLPTFVRFPPRKVKYRLSLDYRRKMAEQRHSVRR